MSNQKVKLYKNPERDIPEDYIPQLPAYQEMGIQPIPSELMSDSKSIKPSVNMPVVLKTDKPKRKVKKSMVRQDYAEITSPHSDMGRSSSPNVGNNFEHTWTYIESDEMDDELILADEKIDPNQPLIDNNDYVNIPSDITDDMLKKVKSKNYLNQQDLSKIIEDEKDNDNLVNALKENLIEENQYVILVDGNIFNIGNVEEVQEIVKELVFGEHELCNGKPIPVNNIVVIKRVKINVGVFLGE